MFKRLTVITLALVMGCLFGSRVFAQNTDKVLVDRALLTQEQLAKVQTDNTIEELQKYGKYAGLGKEIGEGVNGALSAITDNANKFANTGVGKFTLWMVAFKVLGDRAIRLIVGLLMLAVLFPTWIWLLNKNALTRRILRRETIDADKKKVKEYETIVPEKNVQAAYTLVGIAVMAALILFTAV